MKPPGDAIQSDEDVAFLHVMGRYEFSELQRECREVLGVV
jgi:hypothetical protein